MTEQEQAEAARKAAAFDWLHSEKGCRRLHRNSATAWLVANVDGHVIGRGTTPLEAVEAASFDVNPLDDQPDLHGECRHEIQRLQREIAEWQAGAKAEADAGDEARAELAALRAVVERLCESLTDLIDPDPCNWDHNGNCQAHLCFGLPGECHVASAKELLAAAEAARKEGEHDPR